MKTTTQVIQDTATQGTLYMALELSNKTWRIALSDGNKRRHISIDAGDLMQLSSRPTSVGVGAGVRRARSAMRPVVAAAWNSG